VTTKPDWSLHSVAAHRWFEPAADLSVDEVKRYLAPPDHPRRRHGRAEAPEEREGCLSWARGGLGSPALHLPSPRPRRWHARHRRLRQTVDESNLQRQIIHGVSDVGKSKAESAKESIAEVNPYVKGHPAQGAP